MPGMMDTIKTLGLNDEAVVSLESATKNPRFAWDCYRRFIQMYGDVVMGAQKRVGEHHDPFEATIEHYKDEKYGQHDIDDSKLVAADYQELVKRFKALVKERTGKSFPSNPWDQLRGAAGAAFGSWMNDRASVYRRKYNIPTEWGTAVNGQAMVFGNTGEDSGSGVAFTRNPANGANEFYGEFLINAERGVIAADQGEKVLLVRVETSREDLRGMIAAEGILTARGGVSSHAALVARQMGKVCVCGAASLQVDYDKKTVTVDGQTFNEGDFLSIDGTAGTVYAGQIKTAPSEIIAGLIGGDQAAQATEKYKSFTQLMKWCSQFTRLQVRTNADTPEQTQNAVAFGATGIGLTRTEHMFFEGDRIDAMREMILADTLEAREQALAKLLPYQREDFFGIFKELKGYPATIRFLDPPLHEFLPNTKESQMDLARKLSIPVEKIMARVHELHEFNPMLGFRGCRLAIEHPDSTPMQARA